MENKKKLTTDGKVFSKIFSKVNKVTVILLKASKNGEQDFITYCNYLGAMHGNIRHEYDEIILEHCNNFIQFFNDRTKRLVKEDVEATK